MRRRLPHLPRRALPLVLLLAVPACGTTHLARPLAAGRTRVSASLGGPLVLFGAPVPLPLTTVGAAYGVTDTVAVQGELHPTTAAFGNAGLAVGGAWHPLRRHLSALTLGLQVTTVIGHGAFTVLADPWIASGSQVTAGVWLGGGLRNPLRVAASGDTIGDQPVWAPTLFGLAAFRPGGARGRFELEAELRWYAPNLCGGCAAPDYIALGDRGALGFLLGATWLVGGEQ